MSLRTRVLITLSVVCVLSPTVALARPALRIGVGVITELSEGYERYYDSAGIELAQVTYEDPWIGPGVEVEYGPVWAFRFRSELAQLRLMYAGGGALTMPGVGLDVMVEPPLPWRLKPYLWGGGRWAAYWGDQGHFDARFEHHYVYNLRAGIGGRFALTKRLEAVAETELWSHDMYGPFVDLQWIEEGIIGVGYLHSSGLAISRLSLGVRLPVGT
jgi:hypothetical protein